MSKLFLGRPPDTLFYCALLHVARVRIRNPFTLLISIFVIASSLTLLFQIVVFPLLEPLGVDFELPSGSTERQKRRFRLHNIHTFEMKHQRLGSECALEGVAGIPWDPWGAFGDPFGVPWGSLGGPLVPWGVPWGSF